ncbi:MAG: hypothetical protein OXH49_17585 [Gemmatimonadetes bacterium]|nr:hypothetical protein [Gemmatimonadota bacterium]
MCELCANGPSRRSFISAAAGAAAATVLSPNLLRAFADSGEGLAERPWLEFAVEAWRWVDAARIETPGGATWPADPTDPESIGYTLYTHSPGVVLFALELYHATGDEQYLDAAVQGAAHLTARLDDVQDAGLYTGLAGIAFVLTETWRATGRESDRITAAGATSRLIDRGRRVGAGVAWPRGSGGDAIESNDIISGTAGTGLALLQLGRTLRYDSALEVAEGAGRRLLERAIETPTGLRWDMWPGYAREMPNFSHGTAGIAYFLATLHRATGDRAFLDAALAGAHYLLSQATQGGGSPEPYVPPGYRIFHSRPGGEDLYYLSWCHGPVGTNRLFHQLGEITGDPEWHAWVARGARGVMDTGIPERRTPGFWENISQCCGTAGAAEHFLTLQRTTGNDEYRAFVGRLNADLVGRASSVDTSAGTGRKWTQAEHRVQPDLLVAQTGYMQGASGVGKYFLHMDAMEQRGEGPRVVLPDDPW